MVTTYKVSKRQRALLVEIHKAMEAMTVREVATDEITIVRQLRALGLVETAPAVFPNIGTEVVLSAAGIGVALNLIADEPVAVREAVASEPGEKLPWA